MCVSMGRCSGIVYGGIFSKVLDNTLIIYVFIYVEIHEITFRKRFLLSSVVEVARCPGWGDAGRVSFGKWRVLRLYLHKQLPRLVESNRSR